MNNIEWIFLDLGWTLVDETQAHRKRLKGVCERMEGLGLRHSVDELMAMCEQAATDFAPSPFRGMLSRLDLSEDQIRTLADSARYEHENEVLYPGVPEFLASLSGRFKLGVIANQSEGTEERLARWRIRNTFSLVFASAEFGLSKPDPEIFRRAISMAGCASENAMMVGDRLDNDIGPAKSQGWTTMRVMQGFSRFQAPRRPEEIPDVTIPSIQGLSDVQQTGRPHHSPGATIRGPV